MRLAIIKDAGGAAKTGFQGDMATHIQTAQHIGANAAYAKSMGSPKGKFLEQLEASNQSLREGREGSRLHGVSSAIGDRAQNAKRTADSASGFIKAVGADANAAADVAGYVGANFGGPLSSVFKGAQSGQQGTGNGGPGGGRQGIWGVAGSFASAAATNAANSAEQKALAAGADATNQQADLRWRQMGAEQRRGALGDYARNLGSQAEFEARSAAWDAKHDFAKRHGGMASVYGVNAGSLQPGDKPADGMGMAMSGRLGSQAQSLASYSGKSFLTELGTTVSNERKKHGSGFVGQTWEPGSAGEAVKQVGGNLGAVADPGFEVFGIQNPIPKR